ncbi:MAG: hypothetical protein ABJJ44_00250 [Paraglaciecola sp.]|uniref:hypothetical protein n=1 Tax=Paraglaciecola sp. TaxID=1920173 RepID=UPI00329886BC
MLEEFRYILSEIKVALDPKWGACVELIDYEQISKVVEQINEYHKKHNVEFVLPSGT